MCYSLHVGRDFGPNRGSGGGSSSHSVIWTVQAGNTKGGNIIVPLTSHLTGLESVLQIKTKIVSCHVAGSMVH